MSKQWNSDTYHVRGGRRVGPVMLPESQKARAALKEILKTGEADTMGILLSSKQGGTSKTTFTTYLPNITHPDFDNTQPEGRQNQKYLFGEVVRLEGVDSKVDKVRNMTNDFSLFEKDWRTLIIINEISQASPAFIAGLKNLMDVAKNTLFVFTDNKPAKLIKDNPQIFSNSRVINYKFDTPSKDDMKEILQAIIVDQGAEEDAVKYLINLDDIVIKAKNDMRTAITTLKTRLHR